MTIHTKPGFAISQRCFLIKTDHGNIMWDCITYLDDKTVEYIRQLGGLKSIVISHPHYYSTSVVWAETFGCNIYVSDYDKEFIMRPSKHYVMVKEDRFKPVSDVLVVRAGGHFPGSLVLLHKRRLYVGDTILTTPAAKNAKQFQKDQVAFTALWSYPNMIPLSLYEMKNLYEQLKDLEFDDAHTAFPGRDSYGDGTERLKISFEILLSRYRIEK